MLHSKSLRLYLSCTLVVAIVVAAIPTLSSGIEDSTLDSTIQKEPGQKEPVEKPPSWEELSSLTWIKEHKPEEIEHAQILRVYRIWEVMEEIEKTELQYRPWRAANTLKAGSFDKFLEGPGVKMVAKEIDRQNQEVCDLIIEYVVFKVVSGLHIVPLEGYPTIEQAFESWRDEYYGPSELMTKGTRAARAVTFLSALQFLLWREPHVIGETHIRQWTIRAYEDIHYTLYEHTGEERVMLLTHYWGQYKWDYLQAKTKESHILFARRMYRSLGWDLGNKGVPPEASELLASVVNYALAWFFYTPELPKNNKAEHAALREDLISWFTGFIKDMYVFAEVEVEGQDKRRKALDGGLQKFDVYANAWGHELGYKGQGTIRGSCKDVWKMLGAPKYDVIFELGLLMQVLWPNPALGPSGALLTKEFARRAEKWLRIEGEPKRDLSNFHPCWAYLGILRNGMPGIEQLGEWLPTSPHMKYEFKGKTRKEEIVESMLLKWG